MTTRRHYHPNQINQTAAKPQTAKPAHQEPARSPQPADAALLQRAMDNPGALSPADVLRLQRMVGNRAMGPLVAQSPSPTPGQARPLPIRQKTTTDNRIQAQWDLNNPAWNSTTSIKPIDPRGIALLFKDGTDDNMVVKLSDVPPDLNQMIGTIYAEVGGFPVVESQDATPDANTIRQLVLDPNRAHPNPAWVEVANRMLQLGPERGLGGNLRKMQQAREFVAEALGHPPRPYIQVQSFATGKDTEKIAEEKQIRALFANRNYCVQLGRLAALDIFVGNSDRMLAGNLGNWFTSLNAPTISALIDNVDRTSMSLWLQGKDSVTHLFDGTIVSLNSLATGNLPNLSRSLAENLLDMAKIIGEFASDEEMNAWGDQVGEDNITRRQLMANGIKDGLENGKQLIITQLAGKKKKLTQTRKNIKGVSKGTTEDGEVWWKLLKRRARRLAKLG